MGIVEAYKMSKRDMPKYLFQFTYRHTLYCFLALVLICVGSALFMAFFGEIPNAETIVVVCGLGSMFLVLVCFLTKAYFVYKRLALETAETFEKEFSNLSFEDAEKYLKEEKVLDDTGFLYVVEKPNQEKEAGKALFENSKLYFQALYWVGKVYLSLIVLDYEAKEAIVAYDLSPSLFCYLKEKGFTFVNQPTFLLFNRDKKRFFKILCKNSDSPYVNRIDKKAATIFKKANL